jgi:hypothetical protein
MLSHPCTDKGLSGAHIRVFHGITTGLRRGLVQDLLAHGLLQGDAVSYAVPKALVEQLADWVEPTAVAINAEFDCKHGGA